jgi:hypothetical protein
LYKILKKPLFVGISIMLISYTSKAQLQKDSSLHKKNIFTLAFYKQPGKDSMVDFVDGIYRVLKINKDRSIGETISKPQFSFIPAVEYSMISKLAASLNANYVKPSKYLATKNATYSTELKITQNKQIISQFISNIWLKNNEYNINTNWSYLKFPQKDFGLGTANNQLDRFDQIDYSYLKLHQSIVKRIAQNWYIGPGLNIDFRWNISDSSTVNKPIYGFTQYGPSKTSNSTGLTVDLLYDSRTSIVNPNTASAYLNLSYRSNLTFLGSDYALQSITMDLRKYIPLFRKNMLAFWSYNVLTLSGKAPYLDIPYTASDRNSNTGRGFIQGRFRGEKLFFAESEYRFGITENGFIGGVVFANMLSVAEPLQKGLQQIRTGYGAGIRIKLNKHSNTNVAIDYAFGEGGSQGIFMNLGEVF